MPNTGPRPINLDWDTQIDIRDEIIKLLEKRNCTVRQAQSILAQVGRAIQGTSTVQYIGRVPYDF